MRIARRTCAPSGAARLGLLMMLLLPVSACQMARMPLPETLFATERMSVSGRQGVLIKQDLRFGPYHAHHVNRSWTRGGDRGASRAATQSERRQEYRFTLREGERDHWYVVCRAALLTVNIDIGGVDFRPTDESTLYCNLQSLENPATAWQLELRERGERPLAGALTGEDIHLHVVGTNRVERALPAGFTTGYEFRAETGAVGAVEVINKGAVWLRMDISMEHRRVLSAASAALLLLEDLRETARSS